MAICPIIVHFSTKRARSMHDVAWRGMWICVRSKDAQKQLARTSLRWLNRVMQDHEARASDLNRKLIFSFFFAIFLIKATEI